MGTHTRVIRMWCFYLSFVHCVKRSIIWNLANPSWSPPSSNQPSIFSPAKSSSETGILAVPMYTAPEYTNTLMEATSWPQKIRNDSCHFTTFLRLTERVRATRTGGSSTVAITPPRKSSIFCKTPSRPRMFNHGWLHPESTKWRLSISLSIELDAFAPLSILRPSISQALQCYGRLPSITWVAIHSIPQASKLLLGSHFRATFRISTCRASHDEMEPTMKPTTPTRSLLLSRYVCAHNNRLPLLAELSVMVTTLLYLGSCIPLLKHVNVAVCNLLGTSILFSSS